MNGCQRRMGDVWVPDKAVTLDEILAALDILQDKYLKLTHGQRRLEVALTGSMLVAGYAAALRGEELSLIDIGIVQKYWAEGRYYQRKSHVPLALVGRFKQTNGALKTFIQPLAPHTALGIQIQTWIGQAIEEYEKMGVNSGPMFRTVLKNGSVKHATVSHLDNLFHDILKHVQLRHPETIRSEIKIEDLYSVCRSLQRGATTEAQNRKITNLIIESNNCWKKHMRANGILPSMSMLEHYTNAKTSVETIIQFLELM
ncbi:hypothetical protein ACA910_003522 [Epithemia clementina (nom. ined.)]